VLPDVKWYSRAIAQKNGPYMKMWGYAPGGHVREKFASRA
jgi:hypothetical protein